MSRSDEARTVRTWLGLSLGVLLLAWAIFVVVALGSAEDRYFRTCAPSCLGEMPDSYVVEHALLAMALVGIPMAIVAGVWFFVEWLNSSDDG